MSAQTHPVAGGLQILKGAALSWAINAVINGAIQAVLLWGKGPLAMILSAVAHVTLKAPKKRFLFTGLWLVLKHRIFAFGAVVAGAIVWQRAMGSVEVSLLSVVGLLGLLAGLVAAVVNYMTIIAVVRDDQ